jgi:ABC-type sugar transport system ATPase subunit
VVALDDVSASVQQREILALLGPSGCGKTTFLRAIAGLEQLDSGTICIAGRDVTSVAPQFRGVAMVFQDGALFPHLRARANISVALGRQDRSARRQAAARIDDVAKMLRIESLLDRLPHQLSGGQRQRIGIARALVAEPTLLLMDEPFANLDADLRVELRRELRRLHRVGALAETVFVTHDQTEALGIAHRIAVMFEGRISQIGTPSELLNSPASLAVARFLGVPRINVIETDAGHTITIRPSDLLPSFQPESLILTGDVVAGEPFAGNWLITIRTNQGTEIEGVVPWDRPPGFGQALELGCERDRIYFFRSDTGERLFPTAQEARELCERIR